MRHAVQGSRFGRHKSWRKATVRDLAKATLVHERISTTKVKAKEARKLVDRLITMGKKGSLAQMRRAYAVLCNHKLVSELFKNIAPRFQLRQGGYTRIIPLAEHRRGDNAEMVLLELTEKKPVEAIKPKVKKAKKPVAEAPASEAAVTADKKPETKKAKEYKPVEKTKAEPKGKGDKKIVGGIKKMFRRKASGE